MTAPEEFSSERVIASNSVLNRGAGASSSLYQRSVAVLERLARVPGFKEAFMEEVDEQLLDGVPSSPLAPPGAGPGAGAAGALRDPVARMLNALRRGSSLCFLFNAIGLEAVLEVNPLASGASIKACQRSAAHFIMALKKELRFSEDDLFAIRELYGTDTYGISRVVHTVSATLDILEERGVLLDRSRESGELSEFALAAEGPAVPRGEAGLLSNELLQSERKYVHDLDLLQRYKRHVEDSGVLTQDQVHSLFLNLNALADVQRRFLMALEANALLAPREQRIGSLFVHMEDAFAVYEPYCANLEAAQALATDEQVALNEMAARLRPGDDCKLNASYELPQFLIKPVQRICKYPLLLAGLAKAVRAEYERADYEMNGPTGGTLNGGGASASAVRDLELGLQSSQRVTERVNEIIRREENIKAVKDLIAQVEDWKGHDVASFGELLLRDTFTVIKNDSEREYRVFLFERIILCCKDPALVRKRTPSLSSDLKLRLSNQPKKLQLKGRIFVTNLTSVQPVGAPLQSLLQVRWRGDAAEEGLVIKCRTPETQRLWHGKIHGAMANAAALYRSAKRQQQHSALAAGAQTAPKPYTHTKSFSLGKYTDRPADRSIADRSAVDRSMTDRSASSSSVPTSTRSPMSRTPSSDAADASFGMRASAGIPPYYAATERHRSQSNGSSIAGLSVSIPRQQPNGSNTWSMSDIDSTLPSTPFSQHPFSEFNTPSPVTKAAANRSSNLSATSIPEHPARPHARSSSNSSGYMPTTHASLRHRIPGSHKIRVHFGDDTFAMIVPHDASFDSFFHKVLKKVSLCVPQVPPNLRLRYIDEDGDRVLVTSDDDFTIALDPVNAKGGWLNFYAT